MHISRRAASRLIASTAIYALGGGAALADLRQLGRADWAARAPAFAMTRQRPVRLTLHHTATRQQPGRSLAAKLKALQRFSQSEERLADGRLKKAWADVPYHYYVASDGLIGEGRSVKFAGDTNTNYDPQGHIGIAVEGNFEKEQPTEAQITALVELLSFLAQRHRISIDAISHHRAFAATACPGRGLLRLLPQIISRVASAATKRPQRRAQASPSPRATSSSPLAPQTSLRPRKTGQRP